jgi:predicted kinase
MLERHVVLFCGPAFSGKSTLANHLVQRLASLYISLDEINAQRGLHGGFSIPPAEWQRTHQLALAALKKGLAAGTLSTVIDDTNCYRFLRDAYRNVASSFGVPVVTIVIRIPPLQLLSRVTFNQDESVRRGVSGPALERQLATFEWPAQDEAPCLYYTPEEPPDAWVSRHFLSGPAAGTAAGA